MQRRIPAEKLPPEELWTERYLTDRMQTLFDAAGNIAEDLVFTDKAADEDTAIITADDEITYGELRTRVNQVGNLLLDHGINPGERVLVQCGNEPLFYETVFALQKINAIPVPVSPLNTEDDVSFIVEDADAAWVITTEQYTDHYRDLPVSVLTAPLDMTGYDDTLEPRGNPDDYALLLYSSGTTGNPKGTLKEHRELLADGEVMADALDLADTDIVGGTAPVSFAMGYLVFVLTPFRRGSTVSLLNTRDSNVIADRIERDGITVFSAVPTSYNKILDAIAGEDRDFSAMRVGMTGGEELKRHTYDRWQDRFGLALDNHYGCTELLTIALYQHQDMNPTPCQNGVPPDDLDVTLLDGETEGELAVKAPVRVRYWNNEEEQRKAVQEGYFQMGDIFKKDDSGEYIFKCRKDNLIVTSGYKVSANDVENALLEHPKVADAAVIGVPDDTRGQRIKAFVVADNGLQDERGKGELQGYVKASIAPYKYPRELTFIDEIPQTDIGKVDRQQLERLHAQSAE